MYVYININTNKQMYIYNLYVCMVHTNTKIYKYLYMYMYGVLVRKNGKCFGSCSQILPTEINVICKTLTYIYIYSIQGTATRVPTLSRLFKLNLSRQREKSDKTSASLHTNQGEASVPSGSHILKNLHSIFYTLYSTKYQVDSTIEHGK